MAVWYELEKKEAICNVLRRLQWKMFNVCVPMAEAVQDIEVAMIMNGTVNRTPLLN